MRLVMRVLVLIALPGLVFSWMPGAARTAFLRECGAPELLLMSLLRPFGDCTLSVRDAALISGSVAALAVVAFVVVRVTAPYFQAALPHRSR